MLDPETKLKLLLFGVRASRKPLRKGGGGPTGGLGFRVNDGSVVSAPVLQSYVRESPFRVEEAGGKYFLLLEEKRIGRVEFPVAEYYTRPVENVPAGKLVALDGYDTLVSAVSRKCIHWDSGKKCSFCSIQRNLKNAVIDKQPELLAQAVKIAYEEDKNRHLTLTTGTVNFRDKGALRLAEAVRVIKSEVDIPIHVQIEPVDRTYLELLYESGADTVGIHVETFDRSLRKTVVPGKPDIDEYLESWGVAVDIFGEWNVSSWLIIGLGESLDSVLTGFRVMLENTVYPFVAPFRPPPHMSAERPDAKYHMNVLEKLKEALEDSDESIPEFHSGCPKCNGCSFVSELFR